MVGVKDIVEIVEAPNIANMIKEKIFVKIA
jgi:uncharacterized protein with GYD domain